jgi:hypothetical protein
LLRGDKLNREPLGSPKKGINKMANNSMQVKERLLEDIDKSWKALEKHLSRLSETQITTIHDNSGWSINDHLAHLEAWENSVVFFQRGKPRYQGLGIEEAIFNNGTIDEINKHIHNSRKEQSYTQLFTQLKATHGKLISLISPLTDAELTKPISSYHPETIDNDNRNVADIIRDNSSGHYDEHLDWIKLIVSV